VNAEGQSRKRNAAEQKLDMQEVQERRHGKIKAAEVGNQ
jgi:hypothetical protein